MTKVIPALVFLVACLPPEEVERAPAPIDVDWRGVLTADTQGFALRDDGLGGQAAMIGTTCTFGEDGSVTGDEDPSDATETVTDGGNDHGPGGSGGGFVTVATTPNHLYVFSDSGEPDRGVRVEGLAQAVLTLGGVAYTEDEGECELHFAGQDYAEQLAIALPAWACDGTLAASRDDDRVVLAGPDEVIVVGPEGTTTVGDGGSLVAWDDFAGVIYVAQRGDSWVQALEPAGGVRWEVDLGDAVHSLDDLGARAAAAVMVETADGGALRILDGETGALLVDEPTPSKGELVGARDGDALGVAIAGEVHLFDLW